MINLRYRGASYSSSPTIEVTEGEIMGKFRGAYWRCRTLTEIPYFQPTYLMRSHSSAVIKSKSEPIRVVWSPSSALSLSER